MCFHILCRIEKKHSRAFACGKLWNAVNSKSHEIDCWFRVGTSFCNISNSLFYIDISGFTRKRSIKCNMYSSIFWPKSQILIETPKLVAILNVPSMKNHRNLLSFPSFTFKNQCYLMPVNDCQV